VGLRLNKIFFYIFSDFARPPKKNSNKEEKNSVSAFCPIWAGGGGLTLAGKKFPPQTPPIFARSQKIIKKFRYIFWNSD